MSSDTYLEGFAVLSTVIPKRTSATGIEWEPTPWHATQRAAWETLKKAVPLFATEGLQRILKLLHARKSQA